MNSRPPWDITAVDADGEPPAGARVGRRLIVAMLLTAAALDLTRCGLVLTAARHLAPAAWLVTVGVAAAALTARTARGCQVGQPWAGWAALLIGATSAPQAAASGFRSPYTIPDTATAALGILLAITILATAGRLGRRDTTQIPVSWTEDQCSDPGAAAPEANVHWQRASLITILGTPGAQPATVHPTRSFALLQAAEYDAVTSITHKAPPYLFSVPAPRAARPDAAADQAAHDVLTALYPTLKSGPDQLLAAELAAIPDSRGKQQGIRVGDIVARRLIGIRSSDGSAATPPPFAAGTQPGDYRPTPPNFPAPVFTNWGSVTPFVLGAGRQFRPAPPPPITSVAYARALNQVKSLGQDSSTTRTADQATLAKFWGAAPIWNVWNQIAQRLAVTRHASLEQAVTVFANLDLALADATIALYDAKYHYLVWRPITAIREGSTAGNPGIIGDPDWNPFAVTAADPSYPGAHATISQAAATVLSAFYGDHERLTVSSDGDPGVTRTFGSFQAAASEAALSRIFAGQHTMIDEVAGQQLGRHVAGFVLGHLGSPAGSR